MASLDTPDPRRAVAPITWTVLVMVALSAVIVFAAAMAVDWSRLAIAMFGPPAVTMAEAYEPKPNGPVFDHSKFDKLLGKHVREGGWVDYSKLRDDVDALDAYMAQLAGAPFDQLGRDEKLALLINGYNAFTLKLILEHYPLESIRDIPEDERWEAKRWRVGGHVWSLNEIEHEQIRPKFREPRIHWALVCAAWSCPPLRDGAYTGESLEKQLAAQATYVHSNDRWVKYDPESNVLHLTELYRWYRGDFVQEAGSVLAYVAEYVPAVKRQLEADAPPDVRYIDYSWKLNDVKYQPGARP